MKTRKLLDITVAVLLCCIASCCNDSRIVLEQVQISSGISRASINNGTTESLPDGTTIRFLLYQQGILTYHNSGMYRYTAGSSYLKAYEDSSGNPSMGLNGIVGTYGIVAVSPGNPVKTFNETSERPSIMAIITCPNSTDVNGNDSGAIWATSYEQITLGEYATLQINNPQEEIRSKIRFEIRKDPNIEGDITNIQLKLKGAGTGTSDEQLYYYPQLRQCMVPEGIEDVMDFNITAATDTDGSTYHKSEPKYILSGIYAPKEVASKILGATLDNPNVLDKPYLTLSMDFQQGSRAVSAGMMLNADAALAELKPRTEYVYKVLVASTYINITLDIYNPTNNWSNPADNGMVDIGGSDKTIHIGTFTINDWKNPSNNEEQEI